MSVEKHCMCGDTCSQIPTMSIDNDGNFELSLVHLQDDSSSALAWMQAALHLDQCLFDCRGPHDLVNRHHAWPGWLLNHLSRSTGEAQDEIDT